LDDKEARMNDDLYTRQTAADRLGVDLQVVDALCEDGILEREDVGGMVYVKAESVWRLGQGEGPKPQETPALFTRREILIAIGGAIAGATVEVVLALILGQLRDSIESREVERKERGRDQQKAMQLFREIFEPRSKAVSVQAGRVYPDTNWFHPDNIAAIHALAKPLGILESEPLKVPSSHNMTIEQGGDLVLIGGSTSTPLSKIVWEVEGPNDYELVRRPTPILSLRWYGLSNVKDPNVAKDARIGWCLENVGLVSSANWPFIDTKTGKWITVRPGDRITVGEEDAYVPNDNYLLVTRLPNFLAPDFENMLSFERYLWPHLLMFDGTHGLGTRAAELLIESGGLGVLEHVKDKLGGATAFQALFKVTDIGRTDEGFHRFHAIEPVEVATLDHITNETYRKAHEYAMERLLPCRDEQEPAPSTSSLSEREYW
jgi:hypothetical protein